MAMVAPPRRASMGRQKIEIRRIESEEARQVCFSKRRAGLFKKASELSILCGAEVASVVFSPAGKAFSFVHPSVESILDRFLPSSSSSSLGTGGGLDGGGDDQAVAELNRQFGELRALMDASKAKKERLEAELEKERLEAMSPEAAWIDADVGAMGQGELLAYGAALAEVEAAVKARADQMLCEALLLTAERRSNPAAQVGGGGASASGLQQMVPVPPGFGGVADSSASYSN